jgi:hypothetical protein
VLNFQEHITRLFHTLRQINPAKDFESEYAYYEVRAEMDIVNHVGINENPNKVFEVIFTGAGMLETSWTGYFKVDIHPEFIFEVAYSRVDETSNLSYYKVVPRRSVKSSSIRRRHSNFDDEIRNRY